jgi:hypothetical protein
VRYRTARSWYSLAALTVAGLLVWPAAAEAQRGRGQPALNELTVFGGVSLLNPETTDPDRPVLRWQTGGPESGLVPAPYHLSTRLDGSAEFGVRFSRYVSPGLSVGGDFSVAPSHDLTIRTGFGCPPGRFCILDTEPNPDLVIPEYRYDERVVAYHYGGQVGLDLTRGPIRPSVIAGIGGVTYDTGRGSRRHHGRPLRERSVRARRARARGAGRALVATWLATTRAISATVAAFSRSGTESVVPNRLAT